MTILNDLLASLSEDAPIRSILVGAHWTVVCSRRCGLASTILGNQPHAQEKVREAGRLHLKSARELSDGAGGGGEDLAFASEDEGLRVGGALIDSQDVHTRTLLDTSSMAAVRMPAGVRPKCSNRNSMEPVGAKTPGKPRMRMGTGQVFTAGAHLFPDESHRIQPQDFDTLVGEKKHFLSHMVKNRRV